MAAVFELGIWDFEYSMEHWYRSVISGERAGAWPAILRGVLAVVSWFYTLIVVGRNWLYDRGILKVARLDVPVISVGNITTGGTGKTPTVILLVKELQQLGCRPAVLTRGYGARKGATADEVMVIQAECPGVPVVVNPDRVAGGREAIAKHGADVLVLDDGFQHRRLHRDLNIVLLDATEPLGVPGVIPRGTWREPPEALARADVFMITRCEQVTPELADLAAGLLTQWVAPRDIHLQQTHVTGVFDAAGREVKLEGQRVLAFAGLANPGGFLSTLCGLGLQVSAACWFGDHHNYDLPEDFAPLERLTRERPIDAWVTTLKDFVKLREAQAAAPLWHVRIAAFLEARSAEVLRGTLRDVLARNSRRNTASAAAGQGSQLKFTGREE